MAAVSPAYRKRRRVVERGEKMEAIDVYCSKCDSKPGEPCWDDELGNSIEPHLVREWEARIMTAWAPAEAR